MLFFVREYTFASARIHTVLEKYRGAAISSHVLVLPARWVLTCLGNDSGGDARKWGPSGSLSVLEW